MNYQELCNIYQVFGENFRNRIELVIFFTARSRVLSFIVTV